MIGNHLSILGRHRPQTMLAPLRDFLNNFDKINAKDKNVAAIPLLGKDAHVLLANVIVVLEKMIQQAEIAPDGKLRKLCSTDVERAIYGVSVSMLARVMKQIDVVLEKDVPAYLAGLQASMKMNFVGPTRPQVATSEPKRQAVNAL